MKLTRQLSKPNSWSKYALPLLVFLTSCGGGGGDVQSVTSVPTASVSTKSVVVSLQAGSLISQMAGTTQSYLIDASVLDRSDVLEMTLVNGPNWVKVSGTNGRWQLTATVPASTVAGKYSLKILATARNGGSFSGEKNLQIEIVAAKVIISGLLSAASGGFKSDDSGSFSAGVAPGKLKSDLQLEVLRGVSSSGAATYGFRVNRNATLEELSNVKISIPRPIGPITLGGATSQALVPKSFLEGIPYQGSTRTIPENYSLRAGAGGGRLPVKNDMSLKDVFNACGAKVDLLGLANVVNLVADVSIAKDLLFGSCLEEFVSSESWTIKGNKTDAGVLKPAILFVHGFSARAPLDDGLGGTASTWGNFPIVAAEIGTGYSTHEFRWYTDSRFEDAASDLVQVIDKLRSVTGQPVFIVAHSFGGLLTRTLLQGYAGVKRTNWDKSVKSVLTLGTPHSGILDKAASVAGKSLPKGQDPFAIQQLFFNLCKSIACHQAGEAVTFSAALTTTRLDYDLFEISSEQGELISRLANVVTNPLPSNVPFMVGIGLTTDRNSAGVLDEGDALISYEGQRFLPKYTTSGTTKAFANCDQTDAPTVRERLIATPLDRKPGQLPYDNWAFFQSLGLVNYSAYKHSSAPPSVDLGDMAFTWGASTVAASASVLGVVVGPFAVSAQEIWRNRGLLSEANVQCAQATGCEHGSFSLLKRALTEANFTCSRSEVGLGPTRITLSVPVINAGSKQALSGASVELFATGSGSKVATAVTDVTGIAKFDIVFSANASFQLEATANGFVRKTGLTHQLAATLTGSSVSVAAIQMNSSIGVRNGTTTLQVVDALTGLNVPSSSVILTKGGVPFYGPSTLANGTSNPITLLSGRYDVKAMAPGYINELATCEVFTLLASPCKVSLRPTLDTSTALIRLTWDANPRDLDSHLWRYSAVGSLVDHIFYSARKATQSLDNLDLDEQYSYGPETTTIRAIDLAGRYVFAVSQYAGTGSISTTSFAQVKVQIGSEQVQFSAPTSGVGLWWKVFEIQNGQVIPCVVGCISNAQPN